MNEMLKFSLKLNNSLKFGNCFKIKIFFYYHHWQKVDMPIYIEYVGFQA